MERPGDTRSAAAATQIVAPADFHRLLIGCRRLSRIDDPQAGLRGLLDRATGARYVIDATALDTYLEHARWGGPEGAARC